MIETMNKPRPLHPQQAEEHSEGFVARTLEEQTAKLPSDVWLWGALGSMTASLCLQIKGRKKTVCSTGSGQRRSC